MAAAFETNDPAYIAHALGVVARAKGADRQPDRTIARTALPLVQRGGQPDAAHDLGRDEGTRDRAIREAGRSSLTGAEAAVSTSAPFHSYASCAAPARFARSHLGHALLMLMSASSKNRGGNSGHKDLRLLKRYYRLRAEDLAKKLG